jgi:hypothetical protein
MKPVLDGALDFACFQAASADFHALNGFADFCLNRLKVRQPASLVMRVPVGPQERVIKPGLWSFAAYVTAFGHDNSLPYRVKFGS